MKEKLTDNVVKLRLQFDMRDNLFIHDQSADYKYLSWMYGVDRKICHEPRDAEQ